MEEANVSNYAMLRGILRDPPRLSHQSRDERFYRFSLDVSRLSGTVDTIHIIAREGLLEALEPCSGAGKLCIRGELRSFNNKSGVGAKLVISVFARELWPDDGEDENTIALAGALCKAPNYRITPMGREICDLMLAVRRHYGRCDYLPCIAWGASAREAADWEVGQTVRLCGRIQSRGYQKIVNGETLEKTAYEVSVLQIAADHTE